MTLIAYVIFQFRRHQKLLFSCWYTHHQHDRLINSHLLSKEKFQFNNLFGSWNIEGAQFPSLKTLHILSVQKHSRIKKRVDSSTVCDTSLCGSWLFWRYIFNNDVKLYVCPCLFAFNLKTKFLHFLSKILNGQNV